MTRKEVLTVSISVAALLLAGLSFVYTRKSANDAELIGYEQRRQELAIGALRSSLSLERLERSVRRCAAITANSSIFKANPFEALLISLSSAVELNKELSDDLNNDSAPKTGVEARLELEGRIAKQLQVDELVRFLQETEEVGDCSVYAESLAASSERIEYLKLRQVTAGDFTLSVIARHELEASIRDCADRLSDSGADQDYDNALNELAEIKKLQTNALDVLNQILPSEDGFNPSLLAVLVRQQQQIRENLDPLLLSYGDCK